MSSGDFIPQLPISKTPPTPNELRIVDNLFKSEETLKIVFKEFKDAILIGVLFIIFSLPQIDTLIQKFAPVIVSGSAYFMFSFKALVFVIVYYFIKNLSSVTGKQR